MSPLRACDQPVIWIAGSVKPANVRVYTKLTSLLVTFAVQFGFGHSKVAKNSCELVPVALCAGTISLPLLPWRTLPYYLN
jgi:hypothetical protein